MRLVLLALAPLMIASTAPKAEQTTSSHVVPNSQADKMGKNCRGRIEAERDERGLPKLSRDNATPDKPLLILAVDKQIDGCEVLVMAYNTADVRPLPDYGDAPARMWPGH